MTSRRRQVFRSALHQLQSEPYIQRCCEDESRTPAAQRKGLGARLDSLTNLAALKEECRAHGLPASGTKAKLSQRLRDYASGVEPSKGKRRRGA